MTHKQSAKTSMSYSKACEILGFTTPKNLLANAILANSGLKTMTAKAPLRYKVAARVIINAYYNSLRYNIII